jgi:hypothetical protein
MFFSSEFWPFAIFWAVLAAVVSGLIARTGKAREEDRRYYREERKRGMFATYFSIPEYGTPKQRLLAAGFTTLFISLFAVRFLMYYVQPSFQGSFFGYWPVLAFAFVPSFALAAVFGGLNKKAVLAGVGFIVTLLLVPTVQYGFNAWGPANAARHADLPKIRIAGPDEKIPPSDPDRMVLVHKPIAVFKGQTALSTETGIASRFGIDPDTYVLQYVKGHRYWIAPLRPINTGDTFWTPLFGGQATSPGYVVVDAENPGKDAWLKTGFEISLFTTEQWSMNLLRYAYQHGYSHGLLEEPIFEVDDDWQPHYTISYVHRAFGGMTGRTLEKVIAVDVSKKTPVISEYELADKPKWVDRVVADDLVKEWANDWGMYGGQYARENFWNIVFNINRTGTMQAADLELAYTKDDHNVWVVPMTSTAEGDHTVVGVLVFETGKNEGTFYPGIKGFNEPSSVDETMINARDNIKHYPVESVQLYNIYGELTWVAIYASPQSIGKSFGGIGMLHAHSQDAADVIYANDKQTALRLYATQLARRRQGDESISQNAKQSKEITGKIVRIAQLPSAQLGGTPTYMFIIEGEKHTFLVTRDAYLRIPLVKEGDEVRFTYLDTGGEETAVNTFHCLELDKRAGDTPAPEVEKK